MATPHSNEPIVNGESCAFLRLKRKNGRVHLLPYGSLVSAHLTPDTGTDQHDLLTLKFASHDVLVTGYRLHEALEAIQTCTCRLLQETNTAQAQMAQAQASAAPAILRIQITPDDKD